MDIARAFTYTFDDEDWVTKVLIRVIVSIIPIVNFAVMGWIIDLVRNMMDGVPDPMPDWDDFGDKFMSGLLYFVAAIVYNIPVIIVACIWGVLSGGLFSSDSDFLSGIGGLLMCCMWVFIIAYTIASGVILFVGIVRYAREREFNVYLQFGENFAMARENLSTILMLVLYMIIAGVVFAIINIIPCVGWLVSLILAPNVLGHLAGQAAVELVGAQKRGAF